MWIACVGGSAADPQPCLQPLLPLEEQSIVQVGALAATAASYSFLGERVALFLELVPECPVLFPLPRMSLPGAKGSAVEGTGCFLLG